jgi:hypothetical protein
MNWLREIFKSSYARHLEEENARLLKENRALLNSVLGIAGHNPVELPQEAVAPPKITRSGLSMHQVQKKTERESERRMLARLQRQKESA